MSLNQKGFLHLPVLVLIFGLIFASAVIPIKRNYNDGKSSVEGVSMAKGVGIGSSVSDIKVSSSGSQTAIVGSRSGALSKFPFSVNSSTGELTVTTPAGTKVVTVLPQKAIDNMLASHVMTDVISEKVTNELASVPNLVKLEERNGVLGYSVKGTKTHKLFGFIPIKTPVEAFVSAENGQVIDSSDSLLGRILNRVAPQ